MGVRNEDVKKEYEFMRQFWPFAKKYWEVPSDKKAFDEYWDRMKLEADEIVRQFPDPERYKKAGKQASPYNGFVVNMMIGFFNYIDDKRKGFSK